MPIAIVCVFMPPCLNWYASGIASIFYMMQKTIFIASIYFFIKYRIYEKKFFVALMMYIVMVMTSTILNGNSLSTVGNYLNLFSIGVITIFCMERNPQKFTGCVALWFTFLIFLNTVLWKDGGMYLNTNGQMSFVLGTKTSLTEYQIVACFFIWLYYYTLPRKKQWKAISMWLIVVVSIITWNVRQPITTSILCLVTFSILMIFQIKNNFVTNKALKLLFWILILLNIGIVFFNAQMFFENFITNVLHENADLNHRTAIWKVVLLKISEKPWLGYGINSGTYFAVGSGIASINQATHNGLLYFIFSSGIIGTVYLLVLYLISSIYTGVEHSMGRVYHITMISFSVFWISEQIKGYDILFLCMLGGVYINSYIKKSNYNWRGIINENRRKE